MNLVNDNRYFNATINKQKIINSNENVYQNNTFHKFILTKYLNKKNIKILIKNVIFIFIKKSQTKKLRISRKFLKKYLGRNVPKNTTHSAAEERVCATLEPNPSEIAWTTGLGFDGDLMQNNHAGLAEGKIYIIVIDL